MHRAVKVPVGKDQEQHIEMQEILLNVLIIVMMLCFLCLMRFNYGEALTKILSLDGEGKMSKSANQMATIYLNDDDDLIRKKIMKAKTDSGPTEKGMPKPDYIENLIFINAACK